MTDQVLKSLILFCTLSYFLIEIYEHRHSVFFKIKQIMRRKRYRAQDFETQQVQDVIQLIIKPKDTFFDAAAFSKTIKELKLVFGEDGFFHKVEDRKIVYTLCHLYPPGTFAAHLLDRSSYSGCKLFLMIEPQDFSNKKFEKLIEDARLLAERLDASLIDEDSNPLTKISIDFIRQKIAMRSYFKNLAEH